MITSEQVVRAEHALRTALNDYSAITQTRIEQVNETGDGYERARIKALTDEIDRIRVALSVPENVVISPEFVTQLVATAAREQAGQAVEDLQVKLGVSLAENERAGRDLATVRAQLSQAHHDLGNANASLQSCQRSRASAVADLERYGRWLDWMVLRVDSQYIPGELEDLDWSEDEPPAKEHPQQVPTTPGTVARDENGNVWTLTDDSDGQPWFRATPGQTFRYAGWHELKNPTIVFDPNNKESNADG